MDTDSSPADSGADGTVPVESTASSVALVTGGTRGIGRALAAEFAADGDDLVLVARTEAPLERVAVDLETRYDVVVEPIAVDLADPAAPKVVHDRVRELDLAVEVLVNNAAMATYGAFAAGDLDAERRLLRCNVEAPIALTRRFLPAMLERGRGAITNVASTAGFRPGPQMASYHASKAHLVSFTESLAEECRGSGVSVTAICPGPVATGIHEDCGRGSTWLERRFMLSPDQVAASGYRAIERGDVIAIPGYRNRIIPTLVRVLPGVLRRRLGEWVTTPGVMPKRR